MNLKKSFVWGLLALNAGLLGVDVKKSKKTLLKRLKTLQTALETATCPDPKHDLFTGLPETFDPNDLNRDYFCLDAKQAYDKRRVSLTISALKELKKVMKDLKTAVAGFAGQCPEGVLLQTVFPGAVIVCNDVSTGRLKYGETVHAYLKANTGLHPKIMYSGENFKDLNQQLIGGGINQLDLLILPSPKMTYSGVGEFDLPKTILEMKPRAVLLWTQLVEELEHYTEIFSSKEFEMYDLKHFQKTKYEISGKVHSIEGVSFTEKGNWLMLTLKSLSGDQSVEQCIANSCKEK